MTAADERAEAIIRERLSRLATPIPIVAEEATAAGQAIEIAERFVLVDPLDGTREFVARNGEFTINVALVERGVPDRRRGLRAGARTAVVRRRDRLRLSRRRSAPTCRTPPRGGRLRARPAPRVPRRAGEPLARRSGDRSLPRAACPIGERRSAGSSLKFCVIAEGEGDVYPRFAPTMEWDTAAGDAVLRAAGGVVLAVEGGPLRLRQDRRRDCATAASSPGAIRAWRRASPIVNEASIAPQR